MPDAESRLYTTVANGMTLDFFPAEAFLCIGAVLGLITVPLAARKGYHPLLWFVAGGGVIGLVVLATLPFQRSAETQPDAPWLDRRMGNAIGAFLSLVVVLLAVETHC